MLQGVDIDSIRKGHRFGSDWLQQRFGVSRMSRRYSLKATAFAQALETALRRAGRPCTVCTSHDEVVVCTDAEASIYNESWYQSGLNRSRNCHRRMREVDTAAMSFLEAEQHRIAMGVQAVELSAIRRIRRLVAPVAEEA